MISSLVLHVLVKLHACSFSWDHHRRHLITWVGTSLSLRGLKMYWKYTWYMEITDKCRTWSGDAYSLRLLGPKSNYCYAYCPILNTIHKINLHAFQSGCSQLSSTDNDIRWIKCLLWCWPNWFSCFHDYFGRVYIKMSLSLTTLTSIIIVSLRTGGSSYLWERCTAVYCDTRLWLTRGWPYTTLILLHLHKQCIQLFKAVNFQNVVIMKWIFKIVMVCDSDILLYHPMLLQCTVGPRLTNTLAGRTPLLNERFWPVPSIFSVKSCLKTPPLTNNPALPAQRTADCPPKVSVSEVFYLQFSFIFGTPIRVEQLILHLANASTLFCECILHVDTLFWQKPFVTLLCKISYTFVLHTKLYLLVQKVQTSKVPPVWQALACIIL